ncbi:MAG: oligosaccharide flippase family protein [Deltaproteobacteria bacterium]|nr:oligosaccharide flippase family protein [Deltaproteobacteria bacterium]MBW2532026.1 oligosaccharide flippase family protein [Deltaproteobacteria bacterium]
MVVGSNLISALVALGQGIVLVRLLSKDGYGTWAFVTMVFGTGKDIAALAIPQSILFFAPKLKPAEVRGLLRQSVSLLTALGTLTGLVFVGLAIFPSVLPEGHGPMTRLLLLFCLASVVALPASAYNTLFIGTQNHRTAAAISVWISFGTTIALIIPAALGLPLEWLAGVFAISHALRLALSHWLFRRLFRGAEVTPFEGGIRRQLRYAIPLALTRLAGIVNQKLDKFAVGLFFAVATFAEFAVAAQELPLVSILPYSIAQAMLPELVSRYQEGTTKEKGARASIELWHEGIKKASLVMLPVAAFLLVTAEPLMEVLYGARYRPAALPFRVYTMLLPLRVTAYGIMLMAFGETKQLLRTQIYGMVFNLVGNIVLMYLLGMIGAPIASVLAQLFMASYILYRINKTASVGLGGLMPWRHYGLVAVAATLGTAPLVAGVVLLPNAPAALVLVGGLVLYLATYLVLANAVGAIRDEDRVYLRRWARLEPFRKQPDE